MMEFRKWTAVPVVVLVLVCITQVPAQSTPEPSRESGGRVEVSVHFGGTWSKRFSSGSFNCSDRQNSSSTSDSCNPADNFRDASGGAVPTPLIPVLPAFLATEGVEPQNGPSFGGRVGVDLNPRWQVEFTWNYVAAPFRFTNNFAALDSAIQLFCDPNSFSTCNEDRNFAIIDRGQDRGAQQHYLFNVNYHFRPDRRFTPYVGGGAGAVKWYNGPTIRMVHIKPSCAVNCRFDISKVAGGDTAPALDFAVGFKYHVTEHFGFRAEVMNVVSFPEFEHTFDYIDQDDFFGDGPGTLLPPTGTLRQNVKMNQINLTGGVFWRF
jgi:opacity protein-like surface antigen